MGDTRYDKEARASRTVLYSTMVESGNDHLVFTQNTERKAHPEMIPSVDFVRESRFSEAHPKVVPVILGIDVTGSMGVVPKTLITEGLPTLFGKVLEKGKDIALCFTAIGDYVTDNYPFQVGQFESGDQELDLWLTRMYLEKGGGTPGEESYEMAWIFAQNNVSADYIEKGFGKGIIITIGDENFREAIPSNIMKSFSSQQKYSVDTYRLLEIVKQNWHVFHIHLNIPGTMGNAFINPSRWNKALSQNFITVNKLNELIDTIVNIIDNSIQEAHEEIPEVKKPDSDFIEKIKKGEI